MDIATPDATASQSRRRSTRLAVGVWIGLASVLLVGFVMPPRFGAPIDQKQRVLREVARLEGQVRTSPDGEVESIDLNGTRATDRTLLNVKEFGRLQSLILTGTRSTDAGLGHLQELKNLQVLHLRDTPVTDVGLGHLKRLTSLKELDLKGTLITDAALEDLRGALPDCSIWDRAGRFLGPKSDDLVLRPGSWEVFQPELSTLTMGELADHLDVALIGRATRQPFSLDAILLELIHRGGSDAERLLADRLNFRHAEPDETERIAGGIVAATDEDAKELWETGIRSRRLELLTALRRIQKKPDPLQVEVRLTRDVDAWAQIQDLTI
ncbi:MAG: leucine-rich repeat domain-containing protein [Planctomycetales bacterium]